MNRQKLSNILLILFIITISIGYFFAHRVDESLQSIDLYFFEIGTFGFVDMQQMLYTVKMKMLIITFAILWYLTSKDWWRNVILLIVAIELIKLINLLNENSEAFDEINFISSFLITAPIVLILYFISKKINNYNKYVAFKNRVDHEVDILLQEVYMIEDERTDTLKSNFRMLKSKKHRLSDSEYLKELQLLKSEFYE